MAATAAAISSPTALSSAAPAPFCPKPVLTFIRSTNSFSSSSLYPSISLHHRIKPFLPVISRRFPPPAAVAEAEIVEDATDEDDAAAAASAVATVPATKPKKGKAALPLKRDRVIFLITFSILSLF